MARAADTDPVVGTDPVVDTRQRPDMVLREDMLVRFDDLALAFMIRFTFAELHTAPMDHLAVPLEELTRRAMAAQAAVLLAVHTVDTPVAVRPEEVLQVDTPLAVRRAAMPQATAEEALAPTAEAPVAALAP